MRQRTALAIQTVAVGIVLVLAVTVSLSRPAEPTDDNVGRTPANAQLVRIESVLNGESLVVRAIGLGMPLPVGIPVRARLTGVAAPAIGKPGQCFGGRAHRQFRSLAAPGSIGWVSTAAGSPEPNGVWPIYFWDASATLVNAQLIEGGFAMLNQGDAPDAPSQFVAAFVTAQDHAEVTLAGMWGLCAPVDRTIGSAESRG